MDKLGVNRMIESKLQQTKRQTHKSVEIHIAVFYNIDRILAKFN